MNSRSLMLRTAIACALAGTAVSAAQAGVFLPFGGRPANQVVHPQGYTGTGPSTLAVSVCLDPAAAPSGGLTQAEQAVRNVVAEFNRMQGQGGNVSTNPTPGDDFEGVLLHEVGHCLGMGHSVFGPSEVGTGSSRLYYANALPGTNGTFDTAVGTDAVLATRDDVRGDDVNLNWFRPGVNDPFAALPSVIDRSTYTVDTAQLPAGHNYVEVVSAFNPCNTAANSSALRSQAATQNTMYPVLCGNNLLRKLALDDVALLRIARAGKDGTQGTADDYVTTLSYAGQTASCNVPIRFNTSTGYARCSVGANVGGGLGNDVALNSGSIDFASSVAWQYNQTDTTSNNVGPNITANSPTNNSTTAMSGGAQGAQVTSNISFTVSGGSGTGTTSLVCTATAGTVVVASGSPQNSIAVGGSATNVVARFTLTAGAQTGTVTCAVTPSGGTASNLVYNFTAPAGTASCTGDCIFRNGFE